MSLPNTGENPEHRGMCGEPMQGDEPEDEQERDRRETRAESAAEYRVENRRSYEE